MDETGEPRIEALPFAAQFLLWAARTWVAAIRHGQPLPEHLRGALAAARAPDALVELDATLGLIAAGTARPLDLRCPRCRWVSGDEMRLLSVTEALQAGKPVLARQRLETLLPPAAARLVLLPFARLAGRLRAAGLRVAGREADSGLPTPTATPAPPPPTAEILPFPDRGLRLLQ